MGHGPPQGTLTASHAAGWRMRVMLHMTISLRNSFVRLESGYHLSSPYGTYLPRYLQVARHKVSGSFTIQNPQSK